MLLHTELSVIKIAAQTGFTHAQHLNNVFHKAVGVTPIAFRKGQRPKE